MWPANIDPVRRFGFGRLHANSQRNRSSARCRLGGSLRRACAVAVRGREAGRRQATAGHCPHPRLCSGRTGYGIGNPASVRRWQHGARCLACRLGGRALGRSGLCGLPYGRPCPRGRCLCGQGRKPGRAGWARRRKRRNLLAAWADVARRARRPWLVAATGSGPVRPAGAGPSGKGPDRADHPAIAGRTGL